MLLREKERTQRHSLAVSEQSLPDRFAQALKALKPSQSSKTKSGGSTVDASHDVVFIMAEKTQAPATQSRFQKSPLIQKARSVIERNSVHAAAEQSSEKNPFQEPALSSLEQIRNLYKSVPNVNYECIPSPEPEDEEEFGSSRSPTDSGYRSTPRLDRTTDDMEELSATPASCPMNSLGASSARSSSKNGYGEVGNRQSPRVALRPQRPHGQTPASSPQSTVGSRPERHLPFNRSHVDAVLESRRCKSFASYIDPVLLIRISETLAEPLEIITENLQRLVAYSVKCTSDDVACAVKISLPLDLFASCLRSAQKAANAYARSGPNALSLTMSERAELCFPVGRFYRYLMDKLPSKPISEQAVISVAAAMQCVLEELILRLVDTDSPELLTLQRFEDILSDADGSLIQYFASTDSLAAMDLPGPISFAKLVDAVHAVRDRILHASGSSKKRQSIQLSRTGIRSLHYFLCGPGVKHSTTLRLADWVRLIYTFAEHRLSSTVDEVDIMQAARIMRGVDCPPPSVSLCRRELPLDAHPHDAKVALAFSMIATASSDNVRHGVGMLDGDRGSARNLAGMCPLSENVVQSNSEAVAALLATSWPTDLAMSPTSRQLAEYSGWTPLTWAVAIQKHNIVKMLLNSSAKLDSEAMVNETPLQISIQQGCLESVRLLLDRGADPCRGWRSTDPAEGIGSISPLAAAAIRGNRTVISALLAKIAENAANSRSSKSSLNSQNSTDFVCEYDKLPETSRKALREAMYYAADVERPEIAVLLKHQVEGLPWSTFAWTRALETALIRAESRLVQAILSDFGPNIAADLKEENLGRTLAVIMKAMQHELSYPEGDPTAAAFALSRLHHYFKEELSDPNSQPPIVPIHRNIIDPSYVNSEQLSDIRFQVEGHIVFGHRIVLVNASDRFRQLLQSPDGVIQVADVPYETFLSLMEFVYTGHLSTAGTRLPRQLFQLLTAAQSYGLPSLETEVLRILTHSIDVDNFCEVYSFAIANQLEPLLKPCELFLLHQLPVLCSEPRLALLMLQPPPQYDVCNAIRTRLTAEFLECRRRVSSI